MFIIIKILLILNLFIAKKEKDFTEEFNENSKNKIPMFIMFYKFECKYGKIYFNDIQIISDFFKNTNSLSHIKIMKINCDEKKNEKFCKMLNIQSSPLFRLFNEEVMDDFKSTRNVSSMIRFILNKLKNKIIDINDTKYFEEVSKVFNHIIFYKGNDEEEMKKIKNLQIEDLFLSKINNNELEKKLNINDNGIYLYRVLDNYLIKYDDYFTLTNFIKNNKYTKVPEIDNHYLKEIFLKEIVCLVYFYEDKENYLDILKSIENNKIIIIKSKKNNKIGDQLKEYLGFKQNEGVILFKMFNKDITKYKYQFDIINKENITEFYNKYNKNELPIYYKSEDIIQNDSYPKELVGSNYIKEIEGSTKDIIVLVYAHYCNISKTFLPIYKELSLKYDSVHFIQINGSKNEIKYLEYKGFPTIYFYKNEFKKDPVRLVDNKTKEIVEKFIKKHMTVKQKIETEL